MLLFGKALPSESDRLSFNRLMNEANAKGLNWVQGLEYVAAHRMHPPPQPAMAPPPVASQAAARLAR